MDLLTSPQGLTGTAPVLLLYYLMPSLAITLAVAAFRLVVAGETVPESAPRLWRAHEWPVVGSALSFYSRRRDMVVEGLAASPHGSFSFFVGGKHVVALGGAAGRKAFYESKGLDFAAGFVELLAGMPFTQEQDAQEGDWPRFFNRTLVTLLRPEALAKRLPALCRDVRSACDELEKQDHSGIDPGWLVTDVFGTVYGLLFQLLSRVVGANEVSEDPQLLRKVLSIFERFERSNSTTGIIFPWIRFFTPAFVLRMALGAMLYVNFNRIIQNRQRTGGREDDALQYLLDRNTRLDVIVKFQISAAWAALLTTGANGTWLLVLLATNPEWQQRCRDEVDSAIRKHRTSPVQSPSDILDALTLKEWETEFPVLDACLREAIRLAMPGAVFRKNTSGTDIAIGGTGEVIPNGSYATYLIDEAHMNPRLYPDPHKFNPARYLDECVAEEKEAHSYVGWGSGRHPCLGMKLAKLEVTLVVAYFTARFDFGLSDKHGNANSETPQLPNRNEHTVKKSGVPIYLRYKTRN